MNPVCQMLLVVLLIGVVAFGVSALIGTLVDTGPCETYWGGEQTGVRHKDGHTFKCYHGDIVGVR